MASSKHSSKAEVPINTTAVGSIKCKKKNERSTRKKKAKKRKRKIKKNEKKNTGGKNRKGNKKDKSVSK